MAIHHEVGEKPGKVVQLKQFRNFRIACTNKEMAKELELILAR